MNVPKNVTKGLVELCHELYHEGSDGCTLSIGVPNSDMELKIEISYHFSMPGSFFDVMED